MDRRLPRPHVARPRLRPRPQRGAILTSLVSATSLPCGFVTDNLRHYVRNALEVGPNYSRPPAPVTAAWIQANDPRVHGPLPADRGWWQVFQDPILDSLGGRM